LVRAVPDSFVSCVTSRPAVPPLDHDLARHQHTGYVTALEAGGFAVIRVESDEAHPDCAFIEDVAVVVGRRALLTNPGHPSRRGETGAVGVALADLVSVEAITAGTLDGGDVLQVGGRVFVGSSTRSDAAGLAALAEFCAPLLVVPVPIRATLHLKSGVSAIDGETVLWHPAACDRSDLPGLRIVEVPGAEPEAANVVRLPDGSVLVAAHHPATAEVVASLGHRVRSVEVSEFARADGGLTCLSLRLRSVSVVSSAA
jgi:dimethylargininase